MPGTMSEADLLADLKASIQDARNVFTGANDDDFRRHLKHAALDFGRKRTRTLVGTVVLVAEQAGYAPLPADFLAFKSTLWGISPKPRAKPWEKLWPGPLPDVRLVEEGGTRKLYLDPAPSSAQISALGSEFRYYYYAGHVIDANGASTTILAGERGLLLLRAQAEAMKELAMRNSAKPVQLRDGLSGQPRNGTPSYLFETLMKQYEAA